MAELWQAFEALRKDMIGFGRQTNHLAARLDSLGTRLGLRSVADTEEQPTQRLMDAPEGLKRAIARDTPDPWAGRSEGMRCRTCIFYVPKGRGRCACGVVEGGAGSRTCALSLRGDGPHHFSYSQELGRCRRHAPTMGGYPVVYPTDWCGDHRLDEGKL